MTHEVSVQSPTFKHSSSPGLSLLSPGKAIVSTLYNQFWTVTLSEDGPLSLTSEPTSVLLEPVHYSCHALAASPNSVIICTVERWALCRRGAGGRLLFDS